MPDKSIQNDEKKYIWEKTPKNMGKIISNNISKNAWLNMNRYERKTSKLGHSFWFSLWCIFVIFLIFVYIWYFSWYVLWHFGRTSVTWVVAFFFLYIFFFGTNCHTFWNIFGYFLQLVLPLFSTKFPRCFSCFLLFLARYFQILWFFLQF